MYDFTNSWFDGAARANWDLLVPQINPTKILEIGSYEGASACYLIDSLSKNHAIEIHCVDTWDGGIEHQEGGTAQTDMSSVERRFHSNIEKSIAKKVNEVDIKIHKEYSDSALIKLLSNGMGNYFDFIYIDGSHQAPDVLVDAILSFKLLRVGGLIVFDDYLWSEKGVTDRDPLQCPKPAVDSFLNIFFRKVNIISAPLYQIYAQKISD
jgi:predicted O-methyltransferase YrrM